MKLFINLDHFVINNKKVVINSPIITKRLLPDSIVYTDTYKSYNVLEVSELKHYRINHSQIIGSKPNHQIRIENFWNQAKRHIRKV